MTPRVVLMMPAPTRTTSTSSLPCESTGPSATVRWFIAPPCGYLHAISARTAASVPTLFGTALSDEQPVDGKNTSAGENAREPHRGVRQIRFDAVPLARRQLPVEEEPIPPMHLGDTAHHDDEHGRRRQPSEQAE